VEQAQEDNQSCFPFREGEGKFLITRYRSYILTNVPFKNVRKTSLLVLQVTFVSVQVT